MGKSTPSAPAAPDPFATARAQTGSNTSTAIANTVLGNANETGPLGSVRYQQNGSYRLGEPVLDAQGNPTTTRRWVADGSGTPNDPQYRQAVGGSYAGGPDANGQSGSGVSYIDSRTGQPWQDSSSGGSWVEDQAMSYRDIPQWERITSLSPEQQALYDKTNSVQQKFLDIANSQAGRLQSSLGTPLDFSGVPDYTKDVLAKILAAPTGTDFSADRQRVEQSLYDRLNPQLERDRSALENQLVNQGFSRGTEAFKNETDSSNRQANDARLGVIAAGGQEQSRLQNMQMNDFGTMLQQLQAAGTSRDRSIQEMMTQRNAPINEISALLGQSQVSMPQFTPYQGGTVANTPVGDYVYKSADINQKNYAAETAANASTMGGLFGLGGSIFSAAGKAGGLGGLFTLSDRRAKTGIRAAGTLRNGLPLYVYRYHGEPDEQLGLMADEVEALHPEAVREFGGFKRVNYEMAVL
jgi:hypothetical protein